MALFSLGCGPSLRPRRWWPPGSTFAIDFPSHRAVNSDIEMPLSSVLTCTRATERLAVDSTGTWRTFAANVPAITDRGLSIEPAATNLVPQPGPSLVWPGARAVTSYGWPDPLGGDTAVRAVTTGEEDPLVAVELDVGALGGRSFTASVFARCEDALGMAASLGIYGYDVGLTDIHTEAHAIGADWVRLAMTFGFSAINGPMVARLDLFDLQNTGIVAGGSILLWGWQVEEGALTSPTGGTRAADAVTVSGLPPGTNALLTYMDGAELLVAPASGIVALPPDPRPIRTLVSVAA